VLEKRLWKKDKRGTEGEGLEGEGKRDVEEEEGGEEQEDAGRFMPADVTRFLPHHFLKSTYMLDAQEVQSGSAASAAPPATPVSAAAAAASRAVAAASRAVERLRDPTLCMPS
jgi:hypothetical protein